MPTAPSDGFDSSITTVILNIFCRKSTNQFKDKFRLNIKGLHISCASVLPNGVAKILFVLCEIECFVMVTFIWNTECEKGNTTLMIKNGDE